MNILNIGPVELIAILLLAFIILGPKDMASMGAKLGKTLRQIRRSETWQQLQSTSQKIREIPKQIMDESGMEEDVKSLAEMGKELKNEISTEVNASSAEINANIEAVTEETKEAAAATSISENKPENL